MLSCGLLIQSHVSFFFMSILNLFHFSFVRSLHRKFKDLILDPLKLPDPGADPEECMDKLKEIYEEVARCSMLSKIWREYFLYSTFIINVVSRDHALSFHILEYVYRVNLSVQIILSKFVSL